MGVISSYPVLDILLGLQYKNDGFLLLFVTIVGRVKLLEKTKIYVAWSKTPA